MKKNGIFVRIFTYTIFAMILIDNNHNLVYATPGADTSDNFTGDFYYVVHKDPLDGDSAKTL